MKMTKEEAQARNYKIMQLRGILPRLGRLIPKDISETIPAHELVTFFVTAGKIMNSIRKAKKKVYVCAHCNFPKSEKPTKAKHAITCDYCGIWGEELYLVRKEKDDSNCTKQC